MIPKLLFETGQGSVDKLLSTMVARFEKLFPDQVRAHYVIGSFACGNPVTQSDLDMLVVFRQMPGPESQAMARREAQILQREGGGVALDLNIQGEPAMLRTGLPDIRSGARLVFGEDIRARMAPVEMESFLRRRMHFAWEPSARLRTGLPYLSLPLDFPDRTRPFFGYESQTLQRHKNARAWNTKALIGCVGKPATALLARAGIYAGSKEDCIRLFCQHIGGSGAELLETIEATCRRAWGYEVPSSQVDRDRLREICRETLAFENEFLDHYRRFLLEELRPDRSEGPWFSISELAGFLNAPESAIRARAREGGLSSRQRAGEELARLPHVFALMAAVRLHQVRFADAEMRSALEGLSRSEDLYLRRAANLALAQLGSLKGSGLDLGL